MDYRGYTAFSIAINDKVFVTILEFYHASDQARVKLIRSIRIEFRLNLERRDNFKKKLTYLSENTGTNLFFRIWNTYDRSYEIHFTCNRNVRFDAFGSLIHFDFQNCLGNQT